MFVSFVHDYFDLWINILTPPLFDPDYVINVKYMAVDRFQMKMEYCNPIKYSDVKV